MDILLSILNVVRVAGGPIFYLALAITCMVPHIHVGNAFAGALFLLLGASSLWEFINTKNFYVEYKDRRADKRYQVLCGPNCGNEEWIGRQPILWSGNVRIFTQPEEGFTYKAAKKFKKNMEMYYTIKVPKDYFVIAELTPKITTP